MAVYICCKCGFRFERKGDVQACPDCGHVNVREASEKESGDYLREKSPSSEKRGGNKPK